MTEINLITPQFDREDDVDVMDAPASRRDFEALRECDDDELAELGLRRWSEDLWLFPHEWYDHIPKGFEIETINDKLEAFDPGQTDNDKRFGVLAYGIRNGE